MPQPLVSPHIPIRNFLTGFTTCTSLNDKRIQILTLDDQSLGVHRISHSTTHNTMIPPSPHSLSPSSSNIPPPNVAWEAYYPKGSINPTAPIPGGFSFYLSGPPFFSEALEGAKEVVMSYRMMLAEEWDWVKGGKLPGVCKYLKHSLQLSYLTHWQSRWRSRGLGVWMYGRTEEAEVSVF
jgi:hypothetical protein